MDHACYRCGSPVEDQTPFCPSCGAPQIKVPPRQPQVVEPEETVPPPPMPGSSDASFTPQPSPRIQWKTFLRAALPVAGAVGFLTAFQSALGWLILLPAGTVFTIYIYRRRYPCSLTAWQGAKLGAVLGLLSFVFFALFFAGVSLANVPAYREAMEKLEEQVLANNISLNPESRQMAQALFTGARGIAIMTTMLFTSTLFFLLLISSITGSLVGAFSRDSQAP